MLYLYHAGITPLVETMSEVQNNLHEPDRRLSFCNDSKSDRGEKMFNHVFLSRSLFEKPLGSGLRPVKISPHPRENRTLTPWGDLPSPK